MEKNIRTFRYSSVNFMVFLLVALFVALLAASIIKLFFNTPDVSATLTDTGLSTIVVLFLVYNFVIAALIVWYVIRGRKAAKRLIRTLNDILKSNTGYVSQISIDGLDYPDQMVVDSINDLLKMYNELVSKQQIIIENALHEIKTPIAIVKGYAELAETFGKTDPQVLEKSLNGIKNEITTMTWRLADIVSSLNDIPETDGTLLNIASEMKKCIERYSIIAPSHRFELCCDKDIETTTDLNILLQVIYAVLDNAVKYSPASTIIRLAVKVHDAFLQIAVSDNGAGIAKSELPYLFARKYRSKNTMNMGGGWGVGLHIARELVYRLGGEISVESELGKGTTFTVEIPVK